MSVRTIAPLAPVDTFRHNLRIYVAYGTTVGRQCARVPALGTERDATHRYTLRIYGTSSLRYLTLLPVAEPGFSGAEGS